MPAPFAYELIAFVVGLLFGSFLNVCISRLPHHESIVTPRSRCPHCGTAIRWYDNIPLLSWIVLRGRCRDCKASISWRYPAVELAMSLWMLLPACHLFLGYLAYTQLGRNPADIIVDAISLAILGFLLIGLLVMDWQTQLLPDAFTLTGIAIGFFLACAHAIFLRTGEGDVVFNSAHQLRLSSPGSFASQGNVFLTGAEALVFGRIASILIAALLLLTVRNLYKALRHREGMGLGDVKLLAMIAAFLGLSQSLLALLLGVFAASLYGLLLIARRKARTDSKLPFGSFLAAGGLAAALFGPQVIGWYTGLFR